MSSCSRLFYALSHQFCKLADYHYFESHKKCFFGSYQALPCAHRLWSWGRLTDHGSHWRTYRMDGYCSCAGWRRCYPYLQTHSCNTSEAFRVTYGSILLHINHPLKWPFRSQLSHHEQRADPSGLAFPSLRYRSFLNGPWLCCDSADASLRWGQQWPCRPALFWVYWTQSCSLRGSEPAGYPGNVTVLTSSRSFEASAGSQD